MWGGPGELRLLVVVALLLGLVGMHALVAPPIGGPPASEPAARVSVSLSDAAQPGHVGVALGGSTEIGDGGHGGTEQGHGGHDAASHLLHLCLAVLAAAGMLLLAARLFLGLSAPWTSGRLPRRRPGGTPVARPPPVPRRLAQLCVWRN